MTEMAKMAMMERPARRLRKLCTHLAGGPCAQSEAVAEPPATPEQSLTDAERDVCIVRVPLITEASLGGPRVGLGQRTHAPP